MKECAFPDTRCADDGKHLRRMHREIHALQHGEFRLAIIIGFM